MELIQDQLVFQLMTITQLFGGQVIMVIIQTIRQYQIYTQEIMQFI